VYHPSVTVLGLRVSLLSLVQASQEVDLCVHSFV
jgi:hypothetical protein